MTSAGQQDFDTIFRESYPQILRAAYLVLGDWEEAEQVAQDAFAQLLIRWAKVSGYDSPGAWVRRVAIRRAIRVRNRSRRTVAPPADAGPEDAALGIDLRRAILALPPRQRAAVVLHYLCDLPVQQVADALGCAEPTAKTHLHRGRAHLADLLRSDVYETR